VDPGYGEEAMAGEVRRHIGLQGPLRDPQFAAAVAGERPVERRAAARAASLPSG